MILGATRQSAIRLLRVPPDYEAREAYRHVTGLIASVQQEQADYTWEDIESVLNEHGFEAVDFIPGPYLD